MEICSTSIPSLDFSVISEDNVSCSALACESPVSTTHQLNIALMGQSSTETRSPWCGFKIVGDNIDKTIRRRHQRNDRTTQSLHYFNSFAVRDRVDFSSLSEDRPDISLDASSAERLLPSDKDLKQLLLNFEILVGRILTEHLPCLRRLSDASVKHITHCYYTEMSQKSEIVSYTLKNAHQKGVHSPPFLYL